LLKVAVDADDKEFVGQPCCDQLLNNIWYDKMEPFQTTYRGRIGLLLSICTFGLLAPVLILFRKEKSFDDFPDNERENHQMTLNQKEEDETTKALLPKRTKR